MPAFPRHRIPVRLPLSVRQFYGHPTECQPSSKHKTIYCVAMGRVHNLTQDGTKNLKQQVVTQESVLNYPIRSFLHNSILWLLGKKMTLDPQEPLRRRFFWKINYKFKAPTQAYTFLSIVFIAYRISCVYVSDGEVMVSQECASQILMGTETKWRPRKNADSI